jgi:hypothetical protein
MSSPFTMRQYLIAEEIVIMRDILMKAGCFSVNITHGYWSLAAVADI